MFTRVKAPVYLPPPTTKVVIMFSLASLASARFFYPRALIAVRTRSILPHEGPLVMDYLLPSCM
jgi:hypothetical protein